LTNDEIVLGLPGYQITTIDIQDGQVRMVVRYEGRCCPHCGGTQVRSKGIYRRRLRHQNLGVRHSMLVVEAHKWSCLACGRLGRQRLPGILPRQRASEAFRMAIFQHHLDGINRSLLARREKIGAATVERYFRHGLARQFSEKHGPVCPTVLGIDEHFFTRKKGFATTFCNLRNHTIYDVVLGRSEVALEPYLQRLQGRNAVKVVCMDLSPTYRALVKKYFPHARIVADRFHVIRLINHHFMACWKEIDPVASKSRGLISLMRRHRRHLKPAQKTNLRAYLAAHPALQPIYHFKQHLCYLLLKKHRTRKQCAVLIPYLLRAIEQLRTAIFPHLVTLGETLDSWKDEIGCMWRFTRNNGITEGFHNKMETISRVAYGFRNFENYRRRVKVLCS
jgi:transposase